MSYILKPHQKDFLDHLTRHPRFLLLAEQGTMKTLPTLIHLRNLILAGEVSTALIVASSAGRKAWERDINKFDGADRQMLQRAVTIVNYDKLSRKDSEWRERLWHWWDFIVLDESHRLKKPTSNRCQYFIGKGKALGLASKCHYLYQLTGTLITNSHLEDAWAPLRAILGEDWEYYRYDAFERHFLVTVNLPGSYVKIIRGYRNRDELLGLLGHYSYRVLAADVLTDMPAPLPDERIVVPFPPEANGEPFNKTGRELYDDALESYVEAIDRVTDNPLTRMGLLRQIAAGHIKEPDTRDERGRKVRGHTYPLHTGKIDAALDIIRENLPDKTVLFYEFRHTCAAMEAALKREGIAYHTLNGDQPDKGVWERFQADDTPVFIGQYQSASESIDLFASACTVFVEPPDRSDILEQARKRTARHGQTRPTQFIFLLTEGTIEEDEYATLLGHQDFSEKAYRDIARSRVRETT